MRVEDQRVKIHGHLLHRLTMHPDDNVPLRAAAIFYHGQGDYATRYPEVLAPFAAMGIRCVVTDLPGHGYSPGRRGHCGDEELLDAVIDSTLEGFGDLPYGVMGHSMGGLLAARHLVLSGQGRFAEPVMAWINAPLIKPGRGRTKWFLSMVRFLSAWFPELTMSTGVTAKMCRKVDAESGAEMMVKADRPLWHSRISFGWGGVLLKSGELLSEHMEDMSEGVPILLTQGTDDPVCPVEMARRLSLELPQKDQRYVEFEGGLHELFADEGKDELVSVLNDWLGSLNILK